MTEPTSSGGRQRSWFSNQMLLGDLAPRAKMMMRILALTIFPVLVRGLMRTSVAAHVAKPLDVAASTRIKSDVSDMVATYLKFWNARDAKGLAENTYTAPSFVVLPTGVVVATLHAQDVAASYGNALRQALSKGWDRSTFDLAAVCFLNAINALATGKITRYRTDGSVMTVLGETIVYVRTKAGWRIAGLMLQQPNKVITCN